MARDLIEILFVSHWPNNIDNLVKGYVWMHSLVGLSLVSQDFIVANFLKLDRGQVQLLQVFTQKDFVKHFYRRLQPIGTCILVKNEWLSLIDDEVVYIIELVIS